MLINRSEQDHYDARKQSLIQQILSYTHRIAQYQGLQNQLKHISSFIDKSHIDKSHLSTHSSSPSTSKNNTQKSLQFPQKHRNSQLTPKFNHVNNPNQRRISSSKKIKLYQLQKKLSRVSKQHNEKFAALITLKRQHQVTVQTIAQLSALIQRENQRFIDLTNQDKRLSEELIAKNTDYLKTKQQLEDICEKKQSYNYQKQSYLEKIQQQKNSIETLKQTINHVQSQIFSNNFTQINNNNFTQINNNSKKNKTHHHVKTQPEQIKSYNSQLQSLKQQSFNSSNQFLGSQFMVSNLRENKQTHNSGQNYITEYNIIQSTHSLQFMDGSHYPLIRQKQQQPEQNNIFSVLKDKMQIVQTQNCSLNQQILKVKKQMVAIQTQIKHHKTNIQLLKQKIKMKNMFIEREKANHLHNLSKVEEILKVLSQKQGQRGEMRGRIGTRVDQEGIVKLINTTLEKDLNNLKEKTDCLIVLRNMLCGQIIQYK